MTISTANVENSTSTPTNTVDGNSLVLELRIVKFCVFVLIFVFSFGGNTVVILSVALFQRMKTVPNMFIANLAICDLITTITSIPFDLIQDEFKYFPFGSVTCKSLWPLATVSNNSACFTLLAISLDRYFAIIHPLNFNYRLTRRRCLFTIVLIHFLSVIAVLPYIINLNYNKETRVCGEEWSKIIYRKLYTIFLFLIQYGIPLVIMSGVYLKLGSVLFKSQKEVSKLCCENAPASQQNGHCKTIMKEQFNKNTDSLQRRRLQSRKTVKMFLLIVIIFLIFMQPNQLFWLWVDFGSPGEFNFNLVSFICRAFTYTNSVLNPVIYGICNTAFREAFAAILRCRCAARHERDSKRTAIVPVYNSVDLLQKNSTELHVKGKMVKALSSHNQNCEETSTGFLSYSGNNGRYPRKVSFKEEVDISKGVNIKENMDENILVRKEKNVNNTLTDNESIDCRLPLVEAEMLLEKLLLEIKMEWIDDLHAEGNRFHGLQDCFENLDETNL